MCTTTNNINAEHPPVNTLGIHHLGLSVPDIKQSAAFFIEQLHFKQVGEKPNYPAIFVSNGSVMLTLWQIRDSEKQVDFDRQHNVGLHHFALQVASREKLDLLYQQLAELNEVDIEFSPEALEDAPFYHMICYIPGGIRLELICAV